MNSVVSLSQDLPGSIRSLQESVDTESFCNYDPYGVFMKKVLKNTTTIKKVLDLSQAHSHYPLRLFEVSSYVFVYVYLIVGIPIFDGHWRLEMKRGDNNTHYNMSYYTNFQVAQRCAECELARQQIYRGERRARSEFPRRDLARIPYTVDGNITLPRHFYLPMIPKSSYPPSALVDIDTVLMGIN
uniref:Uncharacterized protein n=1 Tax=Parascaris univalens TaxID=6257 RepID=A0A914ZPA3_PARUN